MDTLGTGDNRAFVYDRTGTQRLLELVTTKVEWPRTLSAIGRATCSVAPSRCTPQHGLISSWAHSLVIYRDGKRAWEGPIRKVVHSPNGLDLTASDVIGWTERRALRETRTVTTSPVVTELAWTLSHAFSLDDPNVLAYVQQLTPDPGPALDRDSGAFSAYCSAELANLVGGGGRYTALGRATLLWPSRYTPGRTRTLIPERHLLNDVTVTEDGDDLATQVSSRNDDNVVSGAGVPTGGVDPYYGLVDLLVPSGKLDPATVATSSFAQSYPAPLSIDVPGDAALSCDAPFPIEQLVPGVIVPVETTTATRKTVSATMTLGSVKVSQSAGKDEQVSVTLIPLTSEAA